MFAGRTVFAQLMDHLPPHEFHKCVERYRGNYKLLFKWIKQHQRIKKFYGYSENAVKTPIWIAVSVYVLVAIVRKRLALEASLYEILQVLSVTLFEQTPILQAFGDAESQEKSDGFHNQLKLWDL